jgi:hypothetical protein
VLPSLYDYVLSLAAAVASCSPCCGSISVSLHVALPHSLQQPPHLIGLGTLQTIESSAALRARRMTCLVLMSAGCTTFNLLPGTFSVADCPLAVGGSTDRADWHRRVVVWAILEATMLTCRANARVVAEQGRKARSRAAPFSRAAPTQAAAAAL